MASILSIFVSFFLLFFIHHSTLAAGPPTAAPTCAPTAAPSPQIQQACKATRYPDTCISTLSGTIELPPNPEPGQIIQAAMKVSQAGFQTSLSKLQDLLQTSGNVNLTNNIRTSLEIIRQTEYRINSTAVALQRSKIKTARAWLTAALSSQSGLMTGLNKYIKDGPMVNETIQAFNSSAMIISNALSMIRAYDMFGNQTGSWDAPKTERDGVWESSSMPGSGTWNVQFPQGLVPSVTVCKVGKCDFSTVQEAVDKAPNNSMTVEEAVDMGPKGKRFVISIKEGVYNENVKVAFEKKNVVFLGDGMGKTVITGSLNVNMPNISTTRNTPTVGVYGDGFMASNLTIENTANVDIQAVALLTDSDLAVIENCEILGHQDTLYANGLRQYFKSCRVEGTVDFVFGNAAAFFQDCTFLIRPRIQTPEKGEQNVVTAHSKVDPAQVTGYVFQNCVINGTDKYMEFYRSNPKVHENFLGRPWREFSRTVFISCFMENIVSPEGWTEWEGEEGLQTLYYGEFNSTGPGANPAARVPWSNKIPPDHVSAYSLQNFIQGSL
ncbi:putative pectinesterase/pectinesterase inhibitor 51 [Heracleum sosnowskyi]|uniref:Pectinesterase n=1 Tax=Heracleum sosnowskyi TaxID=360622 RepID=A0AAD8HHV4_9APIA|nr:putative pectinesterase/pectinesterase inhibitor 51 [Heracleum sosnowskyi]